MTPNKRNHLSDKLSDKSKNLIASLAHLGDTSNALVDSLAFNIKYKGLTTKQTIDTIASTIEGGISTRVYCDKEVYKGMYQKSLEEGTILKHKIEYIIQNMQSITKKPVNLDKIATNYYPGLCNLVSVWDKKVKEANIYPEKKVGFDSKDWNIEVTILQEKIEGMSEVSKNIEDILYMNHLT